MLVITAAVNYFSISKGDINSLGFNKKPKPDWFYWLKLTGFFTIILILLLITEFLFSARNLFNPEKINYSFSFYFYTFFTGCVITPVLEEMIYRFTLCNPLINLTGKRNTLIISGVAFAGLHFVYGNPSLLNCIAGFIFAWAFIKSKCIIIPILLHSLCNFLIVISWLARNYL